MTALKKYQRLECGGLWRETPQDQRREVLVAVRRCDAGPVRSEKRHRDQPLVVAGHRADQQGRGAAGLCARPRCRRKPGADRPRHDRGAGRGPPCGQGRHRPARQAAGRASGRAAAAVVLAAALWLPGALVRHTASVVPPPQRADIGQRALDDLARVTGANCRNQLGLQALAALAERVFGPVDTPILYVMPEGVTRPLHLPGDVIVLPRGLIEQANGPEAAAGAALVERLRSRLRDPIVPLLEYAGLRSTFHLLTTAELPDSALAGYGEAVLRAAPLPLPDSAVISAFEAAQVPLTPYALAVDPEGTATAGLVGQDPYKGLSESPLIPDESWLALQGICSG